MQLILDVGSGRSTHNDHRFARQIIDSVREIDSHKHEIIFKFQLFKNQLPNIPLDPLVFDAAYVYGEKWGYKVTSSVFDKPSLVFLLNYEIPFVKIACRPDLYWLIGEVPRKIPVYASVKPGDEAPPADVLLCCIPEYPADPKAYLPNGLHYSDHTEGLQLYTLASQMRTWEKHYILERDPANPDAGSFALDADQLKEIM